MAKAVDLLTGLYIAVVQATYQPWHGALRAWLVFAARLYCAWCTFNVGGVVGWGGVVAHEILVSAQGPLVFGIWVWGLGVWGLGLTIIKIVLACRNVHVMSLCN